MINIKIRSGRRTAFYIPSLISGRAANTIPDRIRKYPKERPQKSAYYLIYLSKDEAEINANGYSRKRKTKVDFVAIKSYNINRIPSAAIRQNYNEISELCKKTKEPVFLTKNGEGDLVVMDIKTYNRREKMLKLREELLAVEEDRLNGSKGYSIEETIELMRSAIAGATGNETEGI